MHALGEIRRVLSPNGALVDLRPLLNRWPVEVSWSNGFDEVGRATDLIEPLADDAAANAAMAELSSSGALSCEGEEEFSLFYYWDTPKEMETYISENWSDVIAIEDPVWVNLRTSWASAGADARVRLRMKMLIACYREQNPGQSS